MDVRVFLLSRIARCTTIIAVDVNESRLTLAKTLGATHALNGRSPTVDLICFDCFTCFVLFYFGCFILLFCLVVAVCFVLFDSRVCVCVRVMHVH